MTFEEIKEMINSTIVENGERQITGKALNLALLEMITAMEENASGGGVETLYGPDNTTTLELTPEHQAANADVYAKCVAAISEGKPLPAIQVDTTVMIGDNIGSTEGIDIYMPSMMTMFISPDSPLIDTMGASGLVVSIIEGGKFVIAEDGTLSVMS